VKLLFDIDSIYLATTPDTLNLPKEVLELLSKKEKEKQYLVYGGIAIAILIMAGTILFYYKRNKQETNKPLIKKLYPNPSRGVINLDYESSEGELEIFNINGQREILFKINDNETQFNLGNLPSGIYIAVILADAQKSNPVEFIIQK
jgi:hypothetical protein